MSVYSQKTTEFLDGDLFLIPTSIKMPRDLAVALIERSGGEAELTENYRATIVSVSHGLTESAETTAFYHNHKDDIDRLASEYAKDNIGGDTLEFLSGFHVLKHLSADEISEALLSSTANHHDTIAAALVRFVGAELAQTYECFVECDKELSLEQFIKDDLA